MPRNNAPMSAEILSLKALTFLGNSEDGLLRFVTLTGIAPKTLMDRVEEPGVQVAILDFLLMDEALLLAFCQEESLQPRAIHLAKHRLEGPGSDY